MVDFTSSSSGQVPFGVGFFGPNHSMLIWVLVFAIIRPIIVILSTVAATHETLNIARFATPSIETRVFSIKRWRFQPWNYKFPPFRPFQTRDMPFQTPNSMPPHSSYLIVPIHDIPTLFIIDNDSNEAYPPNIATGSTLPIPRPRQ